jgi:hypothetical protein
VLPLSNPLTLLSERERERAGGHASEGPLASAPPGRFGEREHPPLGIQWGREGGCVEVACSWGPRVPPGTLDPVGSGRHVHLGATCPWALLDHLGLARLQPRERDVQVRDVPRALLVSSTRCATCPSTIRDSTARCHGERAARVMHEKVT